jgi:hypothetical protein
MASDKKHALGKLNWVLPTESGVAIRSDVPATAVQAGLAAALRLASGGRPESDHATPSEAVIS